MWAKMIKTIALVILALLVMNMQPPFQPYEWHQYLPNLDHKLTNSPVGDMWVSIKHTTQKYGQSIFGFLVSKKILVLSLDLNQCTINISGQNYYLAMIPCDEQTSKNIANYFSVHTINGKYIYFKQAPDVNDYRQLYNLGDDVKVGYFWVNEPNFDEPANGNINYDIIKTYKITPKLLDTDDLGKKILGVAQ